MTRRAAALTAAALALCGAPAAAGTEQGTLTVTGSRTASVTVKLTRAVTFDTDRATVAYAGGLFGGFSVGGTFVSLLYAAEMERPGVFPIPVWGGGRWTVKAGTYVVYLFADGDHPVTVTVPWTAPASVTLTPSRPAGYRYEFTSRLLRHRHDNTGDWLNPRGGDSIELDARSALSETIGRADIDQGTQPVDVVACFTRRPDTCDGPTVKTGDDGATWGAIMLGLNLWGPAAGWRFYAHVDGRWYDPDASPLRLLAFRYDHCRRPCPGTVRVI